MTTNATRILHRQLGADLPVIAGGSGATLVDTTGKTYLDASGGAAVSSIGHGNARVIEAIKAQLDQIPFAHTSFFTSQPAEALGDYLIARAPKGFGRAYFVSGGSEANEAALKLARQVQLERGEPNRDLFLARRHSYHGTTLGMIAVSDHAERRAPFAPLLAGNTTHIAPCYAYRHQRGDESDGDYATRAAGELERAIVKAGPGRVIAFIAETVVGSSLGAVVAAPGYFSQIRRICDDHGVLLILDEVMCGSGRTGTLFACEQEEISPDMITMAKGLGGGYQPIGAALVREEHVAVLEAGSGAFRHSHTYLGHPVATAAALAVQKVIEEDGLLARVRETGAFMLAELSARFTDHPHVGDVRGRGLFLGLELVADHATKEAFPGDAKLAAKVKHAAMDEGLVCYPSSGNVDGIQGDHVLLAPPYIISRDEVALVIDRLDKAISRAIEEVGAP
ncbi:MAG: aspartate aminotransferase family protein [Alphaproteobacteria bacterium]